ncbi:MAG: adenylyl-sulfate kinase, partial [Phycisphaerae bacterium]|nr:adenylyl-sulfate kinase [Phycisphaerae bacterium]
RVSNETVAAGMILDREPEEFIHSPADGASRPRSEHVTWQEGLVTPAQRSARLGHLPATVWLTGLTGSGKTTIAYALEKRLFDEGRACCVLDGENVRLGVSRDLEFAAADRSENIRRVAEIARLFNEAGQIVLCAFLSPFASDRQNAQRTVGPDRFIEVYLSAPIDVCRRRKPDRYRQADRGEIPLFSGVTAPYEPPAGALTLATDQLSVAECVDRIVEALRGRGIFSQ